MSLTVDLPPLVIDAVLSYAVDHAEMTDGATAERLRVEGIDRYSRDEFRDQLSERFRESLVRQPESLGGERSGRNRVRASAR